MSFEQTAEELAQDVASLGFDLPDLIATRRLLIDYVHLDRSEVEETGDYDLEGLFVRLDHAVRSTGARRVVLDTIDSLFAGFDNASVLRAELRRLFRWLRDRGLTVIVTGERGETGFTRHGLEEYVSDAVIRLDHRVEDQILATTEQVDRRRHRWIHVLKSRGMAHSDETREFRITGAGIEIRSSPHVARGGH